MSEDQVIDKVLKHMEAFPYADFYSVYQDVTGLDKDEQEVAKSAMKLIKQLIHHNLITGEGSMYKLTSTADSINKEGGWIENVVKETKAAIKKEEVESKKEEKLKIDLQLAKWQRIAFWPLFTLGLFGGVYSFIDLIDNQAKKEDVVQMKQSIKQMELELSKLHTSLSDQKKDTLSHSSSSDK